MTSFRMALGTLLQPREAARTHASTLARTHARTHAGAGRARPHRHSHHTTSQQNTTKTSSKESAFEDNVQGLVKAGVASKSADITLVTTQAVSSGPAKTKVQSVDQTGSDKKTSGQRAKK